MIGTKLEYGTWDVHIQMTGPIMSRSAHVIQQISCLSVSLIPIYLEYGMYGSDPIIFGKKLSYVKLRYSYLLGRSAHKPRRKLKFNCNTLYCEILRYTCAMINFPMIIDHMSVVRSNTADALSGVYIPFMPLYITLKWTNQV